MNQIEITYIFHNCFILKWERQTFLFDYPADQYLTEPMRKTVISTVKDTDLSIFSSHNHPDHFNRNITSLNTYCRKVTYILSKDILKKNRQLLELPCCITAGPDQVLQTDCLEITTFRSNDQGVAFLIKLAGLFIYFGGDLANWHWDELTKAEEKLLVNYFREVLTKLQSWPISIAFSNTDPRLKNWAGAAQFIETIKPKLFVPMHTFGETNKLSQFIVENPNLPSRIFIYRDTGDKISLEVN